MGVAKRRGSAWVLRYGFTVSVMYGDDLRFHPKVGSCEGRYVWGCHWLIPYPEILGGVVRSPCSHRVFVVQDGWSIKDLSPYRPGLGEGVQTGGSWNIAGPQGCIPWYPGDLQGSAVLPTLEELLGGAVGYRGHGPSMGSPSCCCRSHRVCCGVGVGGIARVCTRSCRFILGEDILPWVVDIV